jgi:hypothetical protein
VLSAELDVSKKPPCTGPAFLLYSLALPAKANVADEIFGRSGTLIIPDKPKHTRRVPGHSLRRLMIMKNVSCLLRKPLLTRASVLDCGSPLPLFTRAVTTSAPITRSPGTAFHTLLSNTVPAIIENYRKIFAILSIIFDRNSAQNPQPEQQLVKPVHLQLRNSMHHGTTQSTTANNAN